DPSFVAFPNKTGIIYASNRPNGQVRGGDTTLPSNYHYNIFLVDNWNDLEGKQISQLTYLKYGQARYPTQYNNNHFTFISDENGINNRYAGFFTTKRAGIDTVYKIGDELLHNPDPADLDSTLKANHKDQPDTVYSFAITNDSAYIFPITNYQSGLTETKSAGEIGQVTEVRQEGDLKFLYKLKVDEAALKKRNLVARMTEYRKKTVTESQVQGAGILAPRVRARLDTSRHANDFFESEFDKEKRDSSQHARRPVTPVTEEPSNPFSSRTEPREEPMLRKAKLFKYKLKFSVDNFSAGFNNDVLVTRYQPFTGSVPINLSGADQFSGMLKASIFDLFEDIRFTGAIRLPFFGSGESPQPFNTQGGKQFVPGSSSFFDGSGEWFARADYLKKMFDFSLLYYRQTQVGSYLDDSLGQAAGGVNLPFDAKAYTNLWQAIIKYPFSRVASLRLSVGYRTDRIEIRPFGTYSGQPNQTDSVLLKIPPQNRQHWALFRLEYVYDNAIMKATNIYNGIRGKVYTDWNLQMNQTEGTAEGKNMFNVGFDVRHYLPIYRNLIWAVRAAGDFSFGNQRVIYYLGGTDGWLFPKANQQPLPDPNQNFAFQSLAVNLRGFKQNVSNGNNAVVLNSEFRLPLFATLFNKPINNAFLRNFQLVQFFDIGSAWNGSPKNISRPTLVIPVDPNDPNSGNFPPGTVSVKLRAGGIGPFAGGYGFGARSTLLGYFLRFDAGWQMNTFFGGKPVMNVSMGVDF
ncbi:MAG TPA: hypothetical protein VGM31_15000, partial [Puia sp.]